MGTNGKISGVTSDFSYTITRPVNCPSGNAPISGVYQGYFWIKFNPPRKILENKMHLYFTEHNGKYLVSGAGTNRLGPYDLEGIYDPTHPGSHLHQEIPPRAAQAQAVRVLLA